MRLTGLMSKVGCHLRGVGRLACVLGLVLGFSVAHGAYVQVYNTIQKGAITFTGNTLALNGNGTAQSGVPGTSSTGGAFIAEGISPLSYFGGFNATFYGAGAVGTTNDWTKNASRAVLNIPVGATVLYAELIWSGTNGAAINASRSNAVKFITPSGTYTVTPSATTANDTGTFYTRSANVTGLVQIGRGGNYTVGGVPAIIATGGATDAAGWTLAVAYADPAQVARNLTIFVGNEPSGAAPATVSGFCTPVAGPVNGRLMTSGIEGDASGVGDAMRFGPTATLSAANNLFGPNSQSVNFFGSQINGDSGTRDTTGSYGGFNSTALATTSTSTAGARQGYDITNVDASSQLTNSQTTASAQGITAGDVYAINALAMQINVTSPIFPVTVKSANKTSTFVGDAVRYSVNLDNTAGNGAANNVTFFDAIPPGMVLVSNSVTINGVAQAGANPATGVLIGNVAVGAVVTVAFDVTVVSLPASPAPAKFDNAARWTYTYVACAGVVAQAGEVATAPVSTPAARLEPVKTVSPPGQLVGGQTAIYTLSVPNSGLLDTAGTTLVDPIPAGTVYVAGSTKLNGVAVADGPGSTMPYATAALINSPGKPAGVIAFGATATVQFSVAATGGGTVNNVATIDPDGAGPGTALTVSAVNSGLAGPSVAKAFVPSTIGAGGKSTLTVTLTNPNAAVITGVSVTDNLPGGMVIANPANAATSCPGGTATATPSGTTLALGGASLPASGLCTFSADVTVATAGSYTNTIPANAVSSSNAGVSTAGSQTLTVTAAPSVSKSFVPSTVAANAVSTLTITLSNPTATALTAVSFSDIFPTTAAGAPGNMTLFDATVTNTCGGTLTTAAGAALAVGSDSVKLTGGTIPATNVCTITVRVKAPTGGTYGNVIPVGALTTSGGANTAGAQATLQIASPQVDKTFGPAPGVKDLTVAVNTLTILRITLTNVTGATITGLAFTDTYPLGLVNANTTTTNTCGGTATASATATNPGTLVLSGATTLAAGASCEITANVQSATSGTYVNTIPAGGVASSIGPNAVGTSATLNVARPAIAKVFSPAIIPMGATATLTITLSNPTATAMTGAAFTDTLPAGLTAATPLGTCVGTKAASGSTVSISGGTIPANGSCTVTAVITGTTVGLKINTIPVGGLTVTGPVAGSNGTAATDDITVLAAPTITKSFLTSPILPVTGVSTLQIVLANSNSVAMTGATFTDTFPTTPGAMTLADLTTTNSCSGTLNNNLGAALAVGAAGIRLTGGVIPSNGSCTITVNVKASLAGDYLNTIAAGSLSTTNGGASTVAATAPLSVRLAAPTVAKSFSPSTIVANTATTMTLTITNPSTAQAITGVAWSDIFPAGMKVFSPPNFTNSCGGTVSAGNVANDTSIALSGATVPFNAGGTASCSISVAVTSTVVAATPGMTNTTGNATSANANTSGTASANLIVNAPPLTAASIVKSFLQPTIGVGGVSTIRFALGSSNVVILNNANFTDTLTNMSVASTTLGGTCVGVTNSPALVVGATGLNALNLTVPNLPPGGCTVEVQVTSSTLGSNPNSVSGVTTTQVPTAGAGSGPVNLTVLSQVTVLKAFTPNSVATNATSVLKITLTNPNTVALTGVAFNDAYPSGLVNTSTPGGAISGGGCSGTVTAAANGTSLALSGGSVPASGSCDITVNVTSATAGSYVNNTGAVSTANAGAGASSGATLTVTVVAPPPAPQVAKSFTPNSIGANGTTLLKITLVNVNAFALTSVAFTDTYPAAMFNTATPGGVISGSPGCSGTVTAANNGSSLALSGGNLPANGTCDVSVSVTSAVVGTYVNSSGAVASAEAPNGTAATGTLTVLGNVTVLKAFTPNSIATNATSVLKITLTNPNTVPITGAAFTDTYPGGLVNTATPAGAISGAGCSGTVTAAANGTSLALSGGNVPAGGSCDITVNVSSATAGSYVNNTGAVSTANAGSGATSSATLTVTAALQAPGVSKTFTPAVILTGDNSLLRVTITNPNAVPITSAAFTDNYPATLSNTGTAAFNAASTVAGCTGTITGSAGTTSLELTNGSIPAGVSCIIDVNVTSNSAVPVLLTNPAFSVSTGNTPSGNAAAANLQVLVRPTITKSFTPNTVLVGASSTLSLIITNPNPIPLSTLAFTDTFPAGLAVAGAPNAVNGCGGTFSATAGAASISLNGGSLAANQSCTLSVAVSSAAANAYSNTSGGVSSFETGAAGAPSNTAVLTVNAPAGVQLSGFVYSDLNHNLQRDGGEAGTGLVLYAKLVAATSAGPGLQAVLVDSATGAYQFSSVSPGDYFIVIDNNATLADVTPTIPAGWLGTEMPNSVRANLLVGTTDLQNLNFGLFNGSTLSGTVFTDTGIAGGIANNGIKDGGELGIAGVTVKASTGATTYDSTMTDGSGNYTLWIPAAATSPVVITETNLGGYLSTGGGAGTTAGTYTRASDSTGFTFAAGLSYANVNFGDVPVNRFAANGQQVGLPGTTVFYPHQFDAGSAGTVTFNVTSGSSWPVILYRDTNCNGQIDAGESAITSAVSVAAGDRVCVVDRVTVPTGIALGLQDIVTVQASFAYTNASPALVANLSLTDTTTVGTTESGLVLTKTADKATALPGDTITYTITYRNNGSTPISTILISDATPAFTNFFSAGCGTLPAAITTCTVTAQPALADVGPIQWQLGGSLNSASTGQVTFSVKVNN